MEPMVQTLSLVFKKQEKAIGGRRARAGNTKCQAGHCGRSQRKA